MPAAGGISGEKAALVAAGAVAAVGAAALAYKLSRGDSTVVDAGIQSHISIVVFLDDGKRVAEAGAPRLGRTLRHPRQAPISDLLAVVAMKLQLDTPR